MTIGSGFGDSGPFGLDPSGQTNFARKILLENLPQVYLEADYENDLIFTKFIQGLFPGTNEFRHLIDLFPRIRDAETIPGDSIKLLGLINNYQTEIQVVISTLPFVIPGNQLTITGPNPAETITVAVIDVQNSLSRIEIGSPFPFATSIRNVRVDDTVYSFLVTNGSPYIVAVPDVFPDVRTSDFILIGDARSVVTKITPDLFKFEVVPTPTTVADPTRIEITRLSRLVLLSLLAKDFGITDDPTKLEAVRRGIVLHAVEFFKLKGTEKGYVVRGALEGLTVDITRYQELPCYSTTAEIVPIAIGTFQSIEGSLIADGAGFVLADYAHGERRFEFDKDGLPRAVFLRNDFFGAGGNVLIVDTVADPGFFVAGMATGTATSYARGALIAVAGSLLVDGEIFILDDGTNPPVTFEFDKDGVVIPGNVPVTINNGMTAATVRIVIIAAVNGYGGPLDIGANTGTLVPITNAMSASAVAEAIEDAVNAAGPFNVTAVSTDTIVDLRNDEDGLNGVLPIFEFVPNALFIASGLSPYSGVSTDAPVRTQEPIPYISGLDVVPTDTIPMDSPSYQKYFDVGIPDTGSITAIAGILLNDGETFTLYDDENPPVTFEFDKNSNFAIGNIPVSITDAMTSAAVADQIRTAINSVYMSLRLTATRVPFTSLVNLRMDTPSGHVRPSLTMKPGVETPDKTTVVLSDDVNPATTFEFDKDASVGLGNVGVPITDLMSANAVAIALATEINAIGPSLLLVATVSNDVIRIVKDVQIRTTVINLGFLINGMSGGTSEETALYPVQFSLGNQFFTVVGGQFKYDPGPLANQITLLGYADLLVGDIVDFGMQQRTVTVVPGATPLPEFPGLRINGTVITFDFPLIGLVPNSMASRVTRLPDLSTFTDFLTIAGYDYKVVQYTPSSFSGATDLPLRDVLLAEIVVVASRVRRRAITRRPAYDFCRLPILKLRMKSVPTSIFYSGFESVLKFVRALDEVRPIHVRFEDVEFVQEAVIAVPIPNVTATSEIATSPLVAVDNYYDSMAAEDTPTDSTKVVTVETP